MKVLYHFTSTRWLPSILECGYLKRTESNITDWSNPKNKMSDGYLKGIYEESQLYKPVVWMTEKEVVDPDTTGLFSGLDKTEVRITIKKQPYFKRWKEWSRKQGINKEWAKAIEKGMDVNSWWISPLRVGMKDILKIENMKTGEVYYDAGVL